MTLATAATLQRRIFTMPGRLVHTGRQLPQLGATETIHCSAVGESETRLFADAFLAAM